MTVQKSLLQKGLKKFNSNYSTNPYSNGYRKYVDIMTG